MLRFLAIIFLLSGCGFKPAYSNKFYNNQLLLPGIQVEPITSIAGAELYHHLITLLPFRGDSRYILRIKVASSALPLAIDKNSTVLRENINQITEYELRDKNTGKVLLAGKFSNNSSYNKNLSAYSTFIEAEKTLEHLTMYAAEEIRTRLILYFGNRKR